ncbi:hypothetical protein [Clostridioides difficile]|uniref:hypothetical protein n=1 Tax=Clostridioides difficile TaxID=1496 RepID=UPI001596F33B|nr:hypothetical protein [Clostridioides difficile]
MVASIIGAIIATVYHNYGLAKTNKVLLEGGYTFQQNFVRFSQTIIMIYCCLLYTL